MGSNEKQNSTLFKELRTTSFTAPHHQKAWVHCLVHCFVTEGVLSLFVLHVICAIETILVTLFLIVAHGTCVRIFHIKSTVAADILVWKIPFNVGKMNPLPLLCWLNPSWYVWDHVTSHEWIGGHWDAFFSSATATSGMASSAAPLATTSDTPLLVILLETLLEGWGIDLCRWLDVLIVAWHCCCIGRKDPHLLHHCLLLVL